MKRPLNNNNTNDNETPAKLLLPLLLLLMMMMATNSVVVSSNIRLNSFSLPTAFANTLIVLPTVHYDFNITHVVVALAVSLS